jgi:NADH:ubiquinone oxidoreductase subunit F (NADH-binding)
VQTANVVLVSANQVVRVDPSAGGFNVTLPAAVGLGGQIIIIKNVTTSTNIVTVLPSGADTIDGLASQLLTGDHFQIQFISDGVNSWMITGA